MVADEAVEATLLGIAAPPGVDEEGEAGQRAVARLASSGQ